MFELTRSSVSARDESVSPPKRSKRSGSSCREKQGVRKASSTKLIRWCIWAYFLLVIFEGALRKWFLPGLSNQLLVIRDPIALAVLALAVRQRSLPLNAYVLASMMIGGVGFLTAIVTGHGIPLVAAFGARILLLHVPMAFVIGKTLTRSELLKMGRVILWIAFPMFILLFLQFYSPQSAWVNRGVGGDLEGAGFSGAMGFMRPPGTFSFVTGLAEFFSLVGVWVAYFWISKKQCNQVLLLLATGALVLAIPFSISRSLLFQTVLTGLFASVVLARKPKHLGRVVAAGLVIGIGLFALSFLPAFKTGTEVMAKRFENASNSEGGIEGTLVDRFLGGLIGAITNSIEQPILGEGIGLGTNVGAKYTTGDRGFVIAEGEWARVVGELGSVLGLIIVMMRVTMVTQFSITAYRKLLRNDPLAWILLGYGAILMAQGGWAQPTSLGFYTIVTGFVIAAIRTKPATQSHRRVGESGLRLAEGKKPMAATT